MTLPLARFRVLDLTRARAGPTAVRYFADWGADVIQIEPPSEPDLGLGTRNGPDFQNLHRNKRSITLNLKEPEGLAILLKLVERADVVIENYRAGVKQRLGIDYESLRRVNPRIVLGSISGYGQDGPYAERAGFDQIAQGMGGLMWITGAPGQGPMRAGTAVADIGAGLHCAIGCLVALLEREVSGQGQWVSTSLLQAMISICDFQAARWTVDGEVPGQAGNNHPTTMPTGVFRCRDGHINIAAAGDRMYAKLCDVIGAPELATDERFATSQGRDEHRDDLVRELDLRVGGFARDDLIERLNAVGVPAGPIYKMDEVFADPQVRHLGMAQPVRSRARGEIDLLGQAIEMSRTPFEMRSAAAERSEHTDLVLAEIGYDAAAIADLRERGIV